MKLRPLCPSAHFTTELGAISYLLHLRRARTHTQVHAHPYRDDQETHVHTLISRIHTHKKSLSLPLSKLSHAPHVYPITGAPQTSLQAEKPNLFIPAGIMGGWWAGGGEMHLTEYRGPVSQSSLITAPPRPPKRLPTPPPPGTLPQ